MYTVVCKYNITTKFDNSNAIHSSVVECVTPE